MHAAGLGLGLGSRIEYLMPSDNIIVLLCHFNLTREKNLNTMAGFGTIYLSFARGGLLFSVTLYRLAVSCVLHRQHKSSLDEAR